MDRYLLTWINADNINDYYENYALLRDEKAVDILPKLASDISSILFAIKLDIPELNVQSLKTPVAKDEPIIDLPSTSGKVIKSNCKVRKIDDFEETVKQTETMKISNELKIESKIPEILPSIQHLIKTSPLQIDRISISTESSSLSQSNFFDVKNDSDTMSRSSISSDDDDQNQYENASQEIETLPIISTTTSTTTQHVNASNQVENEMIIYKQRERITELEQQILDLTLENTRLRNLLNANKVNTLANFQVSIPRAILRKSKTKNYYVYEINLKATNGTDSWTVFKRYRDFYQLHKNLKKQHLQIQVLDFPPKKKLGNMDFDFVEDRRQRLQVYVRHVLQNIPDLAVESRQHLETKCPFFKA